VQVPPFTHGFVAQSSVLLLHVLPVIPVGQVHVKSFTPSAQVPPFTQGFVAQSSMSVAHVAPLYPAAQVQTAAPFELSLQAPSFRHGLSVQASVATSSQSLPAKPVSQLQLKFALPEASSVQAPLRHGFGAQADSAAPPSPPEVVPPEVAPPELVPPFPALALPPELEPPPPVWEPATELDPAELLFSLVPESPQPASSTPTNTNAAHENNFIASSFPQTLEIRRISPEFTSIA